MPGEWTIYVCPKCGFMDPDQYSREGREPRYCPFSLRGLSRDGELLHPYSSDPDYPGMVEFVPQVVTLKDPPSNQPEGSSQGS